MAQFRVVVIGHGYPSTDVERQRVEAAGGAFLDADAQSSSKPEIWEAAQDADALAVRWTPITPDQIRRLRRCQFIIRYGVGYDNVDYEAATAAGIMIGHVPSYCLDEVATHAIALLLACARNVVTNHQRLVQGGWDVNPSLPIHRMAGRTLGLLGLGGIGSTVARKMAGWGCPMLATDPYVEPEHAAALGVSLVDFDTLLRRSDYLSLHVPFLPETRHLINQAALARLKPGAILVNTARGPVLETEALLESLNAGHLAAAALDVFEQEPLPVDSRLRRHPRVMLSDHAAWYSEEAEAELHRTVAEELARVCAGRLPEAIANPEVLHGLGRFHEWTPNANARWRQRRAERLQR